MSEYGFLFGQFGLSGLLEGFGRLEGFEPLGVFRTQKRQRRTRQLSELRTQQGSAEDCPARRLASKEAERPLAHFRPKSAGISPHCAVSHLRKGISE